MIVLNYSLEREDHFKSNYYRLWASPALKKTRRIYYLKLIFYFLISLFLVSAINDFFISPLFIGIYSFLILIYILLTPEIIKSRMRKKVNHLLDDPKNESYLTSSEITISEHGISSMDQFSKADYGWKAFIKKEETPEYYFLYLNTLMVIMIPKRILKKEEINQLDLYLSKYISLSAELNSRYE